MKQKQSIAKQMVSIPNLITWFRLLCTGIMIYFFTKDKLIAALIFFLIAGGSDLVDGYLARHYNMITDVGKLLDPLADKLLVISALICLCSKGNMPKALPIIIIIKELIMISGGLFLYNRKDTVVYSNKFGKLASASLFCAVVLCFLHEYVTPWDTYLLIAGTTFSVLGLVQYAYLNVYRRFIKK